MTKIMTITGSNNTQVGGDLNSNVVQIKGKKAAKAFAKAFASHLKKHADGDYELKNALVGTEDLKKLTPWCVVELLTSLEPSPQEYKKICSLFRSRSEGNSKQSSKTSMRVLKKISSMVSSPEINKEKNGVLYMETYTNQLAELAALASLQAQLLEGAAFKKIA